MIEIPHTSHKPKKGRILEPSDHLCIDDERQIYINKSFGKDLYPHQVDGIKFMYHCCYRVGKGCVLAHSMGLGKTMQAVVLIYTAIQHAILNTNRILVVCPKSVVLNWVSEINKWTNENGSCRKLKVFPCTDQRYILL